MYMYHVHGFYTHQCVHVLFYTQSPSFCPVHMHTYLYISFLCGTGNMKRSSWRGSRNGLREGWSLPTKCLVCRTSWHMRSSVTHLVSDCEAKTAVYKHTHVYIHVHVHGRTCRYIAPFFKSACTVAVVYSKVAKVRGNFVEDEYYQRATEFLHV